MNGSIFSKFGEMNSPPFSNRLKVLYFVKIIFTSNSLALLELAVVRSEAYPLGKQAAPSSIPTSGTFFRGDLVMKTFLRPFSLFR